MPEQLDPGLNSGDISEVSSRYPMRISPHILSQIKSPDGPLSRQFIPDKRELHDPEGLADPLAEEANSPVPNLTHRYPDRVLFLVCGECPVYCRFCTRKRRIGRPDLITKESIERGLDYIRQNTSVRDVLLSGGDPLMLEDCEIGDLLSEIGKMKHVDLIRIGTRVPVAMPSRITSGLISRLKTRKALYINMHVNHPEEVTESFERSCRLFSDAGIPLATQTVLLKGVNDDAAVLESLFRRLVRIRIRPYYLLQGDLTRSTGHFRTSIRTGVNIMQQLRGRVSGMALPTYVVDLPGGGGKVPVLPEYIEKWGRKMVFRNYEGKRFFYTQPGKDYLE